METVTNRSKLVSIRQIKEEYLPLSTKRVRTFVKTYLDPKRIGNRLYVERNKLEALLSDPDRERFPLNV